jgi:hypothetical protein
VADPVGTVGRIHEFFGLAYSSASGAAVARWGADNPQHKDGKHVYALDDWGLTEEEVREAFAEYQTRYAAFI